MHKHRDTDLVTGLQEHDRKAENTFYDVMQGYFDKMFNAFFFDKDSRQEIFQTALIKLWTEIENKKIRVIDNKICRQQPDGRYAVMTASLTTFLMVFAKNEFRELLRDPSSDKMDIELCSNSRDFAVEPVDDTDRDIQARIVDDCINHMSPTCREILTLFYYRHMSLDEIMTLRPENKSKDGLKTAKNKCMGTLKKRVNEIWVTFSGNALQ